MFSLNAPVILELILRASRNCTMIFCLNQAEITTSTGIIGTMISAICQLISSMKITPVVMFITAQVVSSKPQVTSSAIRSVSEVRRDMIQPTGVRSK